jgi:hypothetical protein
MEYDFVPLLEQIDASTQSIKPELFFETAAIIKDLCHQYGNNPISPIVAVSARALSESAQDENGPPRIYLGLHAFLDTPMFADLACGANAQASHLHFQQLLNVAQAILD